jgi:hypothetical protein
MKKVGGWSLGALAVAVGLLGACGSAAADAPTAMAATGCGYYSGLGGYAYIESLKVTGTSCRTGRTLVQHRGHLHGWSCSKKVLSHSPTQYIGRETCVSSDSQTANGHLVGGSGELEA